MEQSYCEGRGLDRVGRERKGQSYRVCKVFLHSAAPAGDKADDLRLASTLLAAKGMLKPCTA